MNLNSIMEFDHVVTVHDDGTVTDGPKGIYAPDVFDEDVHPNNDVRSHVNPDGWEFLNGYSGQDRYAGPIMHSSEYIGGGLERDILSTPGTYVVVVVNCLDDLDGIAGWAVLRRTET